MNVVTWESVLAVVVGDQSHGKSSLLEALSGVMLPRGEGMKTRMPLLMKLRCLPDSEEEYAEISAEGETAAVRVWINNVLRCFLCPNQVAKCH